MKRAIVPSVKMNGQRFFIGNGHTDRKKKEKHASKTSSGIQDKNRIKYDNGKEQKACCAPFWL